MQHSGTALPRPTTTGGPATFDVHKLAAQNAMVRVLGAFDGKSANETLELARIIKLTITAHSANTNLFDPNKSRSSADAATDEDNEQLKLDAALVVDIKTICADESVLRHLNQALHKIANEAKLPAQALGDASNTQVLEITTQQSHAELYHSAAQAALLQEHTNIKVGNALAGPSFSNSDRHEPLNAQNRQKFINSCNEGITSQLDSPANSTKVTVLDQHKKDYSRLGDKTFFYDSKTKIATAYKSLVNDDMEMIHPITQEPSVVDNLKVFLLRQDYVNTYLGVLRVVTTTNGYSTPKSISDEDKKWLFIYSDFKEVTGSNGKNKIEVTALASSPNSYLKTKLIFDYEALNRPLDSFKNLPTAPTALESVTLLEAQLLCATIDNMDTQKVLEIKTT